MSYLRNLKNLRDQMMQNATKSSAPEEAPESLIAARFAEQPQQESTESLLAQSSQWLNSIKASASQVMAKVPNGASSNIGASIDAGVKLGRKVAGKDKTEESVGDKASFVARRKDSSPSKYAPERPNEKAERLSGSTSPLSNTASPGYGKITKSEMEGIIRSEAALRNMDPDVAVKIFKAEGAGGYQSGIKRSGKGVHNGKEASFGPYQLFTGGGLGNEYEKQTGRKLTEDNTMEGITKQIQFSLDKAVELGWTPWYGRGPAGVGKRDGLNGAIKVGNWK